MFFSPSLLLCILCVILSVVIMMSSSSWLICWVAIEFNTIAFMPLLLNKKASRESEAAIKYFLTQTLASAGLLIRILLVKSNSFEIFTHLGILFAIIIKIGAAPFHNWVPRVADNLDWFSILFILTLQKINPLIVLSNTLYLNRSLTIDTFIVLSLIVGAVIGLSQTSLRKVLAYSSINHVGWLLAAIKYRVNMLILYFTVYCTLLIPIAIIIRKLTLSYLNQISSLPLISRTQLSIFIIIFSLGGLPPFTGFFPKWIVIQEIILNLSNFIVFIIILISLLTLFYYLRIMYSVLTLRKLTYSIYFKQSSYTRIFLNLVVPLGGFGFIFLF